MSGSDHFGATCLAKESFRAGFPRGLLGNPELEIFSQDDGRFLLSCLKKLHPVLLAKDQTLFQQGDRRSQHRRFYFLYSGTAHLYVHDTLARVCTAGSCIGERLVVGLEDAWPGTLIAREDSILFTFSRSEYLEYLRGFPIARAAFTQRIEAVERAKADLPEFP